MLGLVRRGRLNIFGFSFEYAAKKYLGTNCKGKQILSLIGCAFIDERVGFQNFQFQLCSMDCDAAS